MAESIQRGTQPASPGSVGHGLNEAQQRLLESALTVFSEKGYEGATVREIISRAGVTRPVLYYYFENKEDLFCRLMEHWFEEIVHDMARTASGSDGVVDRLQALARDEFEQARKSPQVAQLVMQVFLSPVLQRLHLDREALWRSRFEVVRRIVAEGMERGELCEGNAEHVAMVFFGMLDYYVMGYVSNPERELTPELADAVVASFMKGAGV